MQKQILLFVTSLALFISGCNRQEKGAASPMQTPAAATAPKAVNTQVPDQISEHPLQPEEIKSQPASAAAPDLATLAIGEKVYKSTCSICHKSGLNGAPRMGNRKDWESRLSQGNEILYSRAINGYRGSKGSMPSRGSNPRLSETEVRAAVDYIVVHAIPSWSIE